MKLLNKILLLIMVVSFAACSSDDNGNANVDTDGDGIIDSEDLCPNIPGTLIDDGCYLVTAVNLIGTHEVDFYESTRTETHLLVGVEVETTIQETGSVFQTELKFISDGTYTLTGEYLSTISSFIDGELQSTDEEIMTLNQSGNYIANSNELTLTLTNNFNGEVDVFEVELFDQNNLTLRKSESGVIDDIPFESNIEIRLIR